MKYKGYQGHVTYDDDAKIFHGEVVGLRDVITFQGDSVKELEHAFKDSIDEYLAFCKKHNLSAVASLPGLGMKQGYEQVASVLTPQTTALVCATDTLALGASKYLQEQRIDNLQVASVGSTPLMKFLHPEIITVDPGYAESGRQAAAQLIEQINGRAAPRQIVIPAHLS